jgi:crossover junction endodeoxyribonuclease RuvC
MSLILGLDPGTATTGYGLVREEDGGNLTALEYGIIRTPAGIPDADRLVLLHERMREIIILHSPTDSAVEKLFFQKNVRTAITVSQARGVILVSLAEAGLNIGEYSPNEIKQAVTGYGNADKKQVQEMVKVLLNLDKVPKPDDAADALAVAITHIHTRHLDI